MSPLAHDQRFALAGSDKEAFDRMKARLEFDVGKIIGYFKSIIQPGDPVCFWAFLRMLFPIAESLGDLLYQNNNGTAKNLLDILEKDFVQYNKNYQELSAIISLLYRHSLIHQDEMRMIRYQDKSKKWYFVTWSITFGLESLHLKIEKSDLDNTKIIGMNFDITQFYKDLIKILEEKREISYNGKVAARYNSWQDLEISEKGDSTKKKAIRQLEKL